MASVQKGWLCPVRYQSRDIDIFKKYCKDIRDHLDLVLVRTSDTGQVDIDAMVAPAWTTPPYSMGYLVYRFNDALQATKPIFVKLEFVFVNYSTSSNSTATANGQGFMQTKMTFGTGTDGAGTITNAGGQVITPFVNWQSNTAETASRLADRIGNNYLTYNSEQGFLFFTYGANAIYRAGTSGGNLDVTFCMFAIQRTVDDYGQPDGRGFVVFGRNDNFEVSGAPNGWVSPRIQTYLYSTNTWTTQERVNYLTQPVGENTATYWNTTDGKIVMVPVKYWDPDLGVRDMPGMLMVPATADYPGVAYTVETIPNRPRKFRSLGAPSMFRPTSYGFGTYDLVVLWE